MDRALLRAYLVEVLGVFGLVFFSAGIVCLQHLTTPQNQPPGTSPLLGHQPGLVGIALTQGLALAVLLALTLPQGGGLNPAVTLTLWVLGRIDGRRVAWLVGGQLVGAFLGGLVVRYTFADTVLRESRCGTPHLNPLPFPDITTGTLASGLVIELVLTFFLTLAIFQSFREAPGEQLRWAGLAGAILTACVLVGYPLTGAALNPARWFGPVLCEWGLPPASAGRPLPPPYADTLVYVAGPLVGALLAGVVCFLLPTGSTAAPAQGGARPRK